MKLAENEDDDIERYSSFKTAEERPPQVEAMKPPSTD
jgi:hypothetical protein